MYRKRHNLWETLAAVVALATGALSVGGCAGQSGSGGTKSGEFVGRVTSVVHWKLPDDIYARLTPEVRTDLQTRGITIDDTNRTLISKELPLVGHWVKIGGGVYMTDKNGEFSVKGNIPTGGSAPIYTQENSETPEGQIPLNSLVRKGQTPTATRLILPYYLPDDMDAHPEHTGPNGAKVGQATRGRATDAGHAEDGCPLRKACLPPGHPDGNKESCCLDYNGNKGDGLPRNRVSDRIPCTAKAVNNFVNSDCWLWTFEKPGRPCFNEGGVNHSGPGCWMNHAYRNCQNLDENDFHFTEKIKLQLKEKAEFSVENNTPSYITFLRWKEPDVPGKVELVTGVPSENAYLIPLDSGGGWKLYQYNDEKDTHYRQVRLRYVAPEDKLPGGKAKQTYHLIAESGGFQYEMEVVVSAIDRIEVTPANSTIKKGASVQLTATAYDTKGKKIEWLDESQFQWSAAGSGSVNDGLVTGNSEGSVVVSVWYPDYSDLKGSTIVTVTDDDDPDPTPTPNPGPSIPTGSHALVSINGKTPPVTIYGSLTIFPGYIKLNKNGTFESLTKGGHYQYPVTLQGSGTYQVNGNIIKFTYQSGRGPGEMTIIGAGKLSRTYVFEKDPVIPYDIPVTEIYQLK
jgi:hypothetical protein